MRFHCCGHFLLWSLLSAVMVAHPIERLATPSDIEANWNLVEQSGSAPSACPSTITHTSWMRLSASTVILPHNTMLVNRVRCDGQDKDPSFHMYVSTKYNADLTPIADADPLPQKMKELILTTGPNIAAHTALLRAGEQFLMGYESHQRFCKGAVVFTNGTTSYLFRPFAPLTIPNVTTEFVPGTKYLLMIPLFKATTCVYSARLRVSVEVPITILPSESPEPADDSLVDPTPVVLPPPVTDDDDAAQPTPQPSQNEIDDNEAAADQSEDDDDDDDDDNNGNSEDDNDDVCFPASAKVSLRDGSVISISDLQLGDQVLVSKHSYSNVFAFSHRQKFVYSKFYSLRTSSGLEISATSGHFIYADNQLQPIETVKIGQMLHTVNGFSPVTNISRARMSGLYNPQTEHGDIVVNGIIASTYTRSLIPSVAHAALTPLRAISNVCRHDVLATLIESGLKNLPGRSWVRAA